MSGFTQIETVSVCGGCGVSTKTIYIFKLSGINMTESGPERKLSQYVREPIYKSLTMLT